MANLGSWDTTKPSGSSLPRDFPALYQSDKSTLAGALNEELYFESASSASAGIARPGSARFSNGTTSSISTISKPGWRGHYDTLTGKLHVLSSTSTLGVKVDFNDIRDHSSVLSAVQAVAALGSAAQVIKVNSGATGLEFGSASATVTAVGAECQITTSPSINNGTWTKLSFNVENYDTDSIHASGTFTVPAGKQGKWGVIGNACFASGTGGARRVAIYRDGTIAAQFMAEPNGAGETTSVHVAREFNLSAGSTIEIYVYQNSGGVLGLTGFGYDNYGSVTFRGA